MISLVCVSCSNLISATFAQSRSISGCLATNRGRPMRYSGHPPLNGKYVGSKYYFFIVIFMLLLQSLISFVFVIVTMIIVIDIIIMLLLFASLLLLFRLSDYLILLDYFIISLIPTSGVVWYQQWGQVDSLWRPYVPNSVYIIISVHQIQSELSVEVLLDYIFMYVLTIWCQAKKNQNRTSAFSNIRLPHK